MLNLKINYPPPSWEMRIRMILIISVFGHREGGQEIKRRDAHNWVLSVFVDPIRAGRATKRPENRRVSRRQGLGILLKSSRGFPMSFPPNRCQFAMSQKR